MTKLAPYKISLSKVCRMAWRRKKLLREISYGATLVIQLCNKDPDQLVDEDALGQWGGSKSERRMKGEMTGTEEVKESQGEVKNS